MQPVRSVPNLASSQSCTAGRTLDAKTQAPTLTGRHRIGPWSALLRLSYFDDWKACRFHNSDCASGSGEDSFDGEWIADAEIGYAFTDHYRLNVGVQNIFDQIPELSSARRWARAITTPRARPGTTTAPSGTRASPWSSEYLNVGVQNIFDQIPELSSARRWARAITTPRARPGTTTAPSGTRASPWSSEYHQCVYGHFWLRSERRPAHRNNGVAVGPLSESDVGISPGG